MVTLRLLVVAATSLVVQAFPNEPILNRNTIFVDEKLEGGIFEHVDAFDDTTLLNTPTNPFRLPTTTKPKHYDINWDININALSFSGTVDIDLYATQPDVAEIVIHAHDLNITTLGLLRGTTTVHQTWYLEPEYHFLRIRPVAGPLSYNATHPIYYKLLISFAAPLRDDMYGIYRSWFKRPTIPGQPESYSWMASTQFQATSARFAFPCYDEPSFKAEFNITIRRPTTHKSWSCTRLLRTRPSGTGYEEDEYYTTPVMSTYLLALIVAEYGSMNVNETIAGNNTILRYEVIARPEALQSGQGDYAFEVGQNLLEDMNYLTNINFYSVHPYIKMTQAAIPDFSAGAMENWGLLTYREAYLLYTEEDTNSYFKQLIAYILSHEIAHMWFGNYVTCDYWDSLWLNEGFARYYQYFLTDRVEEYLGLGIRFINEQVHTSLLSDSSNNPQPLTNPGIGSPASVSAMFSTISYNKGASIIRMTEHLMGSENHRTGLQRYLSTRAFKTALPIDLFEVLQATALETNAITSYGRDFSIIDYYKTWTEQSGHPVLNVHVNHQTGMMTIYQRRFNINSGYSTANSNWIIPITFATASRYNFTNTKPSHIIKDAITIINRHSVGDEWVIFNTQQTGFYRVNYDNYTWDLITMLLQGPNREIVHEYNRAQIVDDLFQFARSGLVDYSRALSILSFMKEETEYTPWMAFITGFNWLHARFIGTPTENLLAGKFIDWSRHVMSNLTYSPPISGETFMRSYLRYQLAPVLCRLGEPACLQTADQQFRNLVERNIPVPVDSRNWVYCNGLRYGSVEDFNFLWRRFLNHNVYTEKILLLQVLGCTPHRTSLYQLLDGIVNDNFIIRPQDYTTALNSAVSGNENNTQIVLDYIDQHFQAVKDAFKSITLPLSYISSRLRTHQQIAEFRDWANTNQGRLGSDYRAVLSGAQVTADSLEFASGIKGSVEDYLVNDAPQVTVSTPAPITTTSQATFTAPSIVSPVTPLLPDSANTSILSVVVLTIAIVANIIF